MSREKLKNKIYTSNNGITLITLIITIIVMLILTGVTLSVTLGDNGLVNKAKEASEATEIAMEKELLLSAVVGAIGIDGKVDYSILDANLPEGFTGRNGNYTSKNANIFTVEANGTISYLGEGTSEKPENSTDDLELLRRYFLGEIDETTGERTGRNASELLVSLEIEDIEDWQLKEIDGIEIDVENIKIVGAGEGDEEKIDFFIKYNGILYTLYVEIESMDCVSLEKDTINVGERIEYDGKDWTIIYADDTHGIQMVSNNELKYNGEKFRLGMNNSLISNWDLLMDEVDLNKDLIIDVDEKDVYIYNHAIEILNTACENIVAKNENIIDVRCVGSDPIDKNKENGIYSAEVIQFWPIDNEDYEPGVLNGKIKNKDMNYEEDCNRLVELNLIDVHDESFYLASRELKIYESGDFDCCIRVSRDKEESPYYRRIFYFGKSWFTHDLASGPHDYGEYLRPVVKLKPDIEFEEGFGTSDNPYILK